MKPTLFQFYIKNSWLLLIFIFGGNTLSFTLYKTWSSWDLQTFQITFWVGVIIFIVSVIGTIIHYNKTFKR